MGRELSGGATSPLASGLAGRCPRCGRGPIFRGFLTVRDACTVCGLDLSRHDSGDGPAVFAILILGAVIVALALWVEIRWAPAMWVHVALWFPSTLLFALGLLRPLKGLSVALAWRHGLTGHG